MHRGSQSFQSSALRLIFHPLLEKYLEYQPKESTPTYHLFASPRLPLDTTMLPMSSAPRSGGLASIVRNHNDVYLILTRCWGKYGLLVSLFCATFVWIWGTLRSHNELVRSTHVQHHFHVAQEQKMHLPKRHYNTVDTVLHKPNEQPEAASFTKGWTLP